MILPFRAFFGYPLGNLGVDQSKLSLESPFTQIAWHLMPWTIRFDSSVRYCLDETMYPSLLSHQTSVVSFITMSSSLVFLVVILLLFVVISAVLFGVISIVLFLLFQLL